MLPQLSAIFGGQSERQAPTRFAVTWRDSTGANTVIPPPTELQAVTSSCNLSFSPPLCLTASCTAVSSKQLHFTLGLTLLCSSCCTAGWYHRWARSKCAKGQHCETLSWTVNGNGNLIQVSSATDIQKAMSRTVVGLHPVHSYLAYVLCTQLN